MQKRLHEQERLLRSITGNVSDGLYRLVPGEGIVYANQAFAQLFGYDGAAEVLGLDPHALHAHAEQQAAPLRVPEESTQSKEVLLRRKDGSTFVGLLGGAVVRDEDGTVQHIDGVVTDITDLKEREKTLKGERDRFETLFETLLQEG
jgi:PAS domain S-box-containing protein